MPKLYPGGPRDIIASVFSNTSQRHFSVCTMTAAPAAEENARKLVLLKEYAGRLAVGKATTPEEKEREIQYYVQRVLANAKTLSSFLVEAAQCKAYWILNYARDNGFINMRVATEVASATFDPWFIDHFEFGISEALAITAALKSGASCPNGEGLRRAIVKLHLDNASRLEFARFAFQVVCAHVRAENENWRRCRISGPAPDADDSQFNLYHCLHILVYYMEAIGPLMFSATVVEPAKISPWWISRVWVLMGVTRASCGDPP